MKLISGRIIGNSDYIGTIFNGRIQSLKPTEIKPFSVSSKTLLE